jgi:SOS-response transcriptional repressor LexA
VLGEVGTDPVTELTGRQQLVLLEYIDSVVKRGYPPTHRELMVTLNIKSTNGVRCHLEALVRKGFLLRDGFSRSIHSNHPEVKAAIVRGLLKDLIQHIPQIEPLVEELETELVDLFTTGSVQI